jgi:ribosome-associated protein
MLQISNTVSLADSEIELNAIRSMGNGGQNVQKVASAIHLRFDIHASSLPDIYKSRLLTSNDSRITKEGVIILKAQIYRTQEQNRIDALSRLKDIILAAMVVQKTRRPTKPSRSSKLKRINGKKQQGQKKALRGRVNE